MTERQAHVSRVPVPLVTATALRRVFAGTAQDEGAASDDPDGLPSIVAVDDLSLSVRPGELVALVGPSGCGKTTVLNLLGLVDRPCSGDVVLEGRSTAQLDDDARTLIRRRRIGHIFQLFHLVPHLTLLQNVELPLLLDGIGPARSGKRALDLLGMLGLEGRAHDFPHRLSGGQMQRVAIARALAADPALILADEPTGSLDSTTGHEVLTILEKLVGEGSRAVVCATHSTEAARRATRCIHLRDGRVISGE